MNDNTRITIIAIDPGLSGGIAVHIDGQPVSAHRMPATEGDLLDLLRELAADPAHTFAVVEQVGGYIGKAQPASGAFKFGRNFGFTLGVLQTLGVRTRTVTPVRWQKPLGLGTAPACASRTEWKNKLKACAQRLCAQRLYPHVQCTLATADALRILYYAMSVGLITVPTIQTAGRGRLAPTA